MKIMTKIAAVTIAAAALFALAGCSDAHDPNEVIQASNQNSEIDHTKPTEAINARYNATDYKHTVEDRQLVKTLVQLYSWMLKMYQKMRMLALWVLFLTLKKKTV